MKTILFQGDSITDAQRYKDDHEHMGSGYAIMVAGKLGVDNVGEYLFVNRGLSGNRTIDVEARMQRDIIDVKPDYMSLMIGINDVWHEIDLGRGCDLDTYEHGVSNIIETTQRECPGVKIMLIEPYVLEEYETRNRPDQPERWATFRREIDLRREKTKEIAEKYDVSFITLQEKFDKLAEKTGVAYWASDGVHPTPAGHEFIAREWIKEFEKIK